MICSYSLVPAEVEKRSPIEETILKSKAGKVTSALMWIAVAGRQQHSILTVLTLHLEIDTFRLAGQRQVERVTANVTCSKT